MEIKDHILYGSNVKKMIPSPNHGGKFQDGYPDTIIMHYTGGPYKQSINTLTNPRVRASAHVVVDRDGSVTQLVPFNIIAWHAGKSYYNGRSGFNDFSIGIEMVNAGPLTKSGNVFRAWYGEAFSPSEVIEAVHRNETRPRYWQVYTPEQIETVKELAELLIDTYGIKYILGHEEIAPKRKLDPGPAFPLDKLRAQLLGSKRDETGAPEPPQVGRVVANSLNIRLRPRTDAPLVARPLPKGTKVYIKDEHNGWYKVTVEIEGWVFAKYIEPE